ncbi:MAG TPA: DUF6515 family protein [Acidobacteriota bacterium]|nr:DUF6515 family protein [Acidobacteriota bacterium]
MTTSKEIAVWILVVTAMSFAVPGKLFGGVRQMRTVNSLNTNNTNVGTNAYADLDSGYATVNPNYNDRATAYRDENGNVAVDPGRAVAAGQNGAAVYNGYGAVVTTGTYYDYNGYYNSAPAGAMLPMGTVLQYLPSSAVPVMVGGARYYHDSGVYFAEVFDGTAVVYQVVEAPLGAVVTSLPAGCAVQNYNGKSITVCGNTYYMQVAGGYQVVALN